MNWLDVFACLFDVCFCVHVQKMFVCVLCMSLCVCCVCLCVCVCVFVMRLLTACGA